MILSLPPPSPQFSLKVIEFDVERDRFADFSPNHLRTIMPNYRRF